MVSVVLGCALVVASPAGADIRIQFNDSFGNSGGAGHGGEFLLNEIVDHTFADEGYATPNSLPGSLGGVSGFFEVFCVELNEHINFSSTYRVEVSTEARNGGVGNNDAPGPLGGDLISSETAYLYSQFITGVLGSYVYSTTQNTSGDGDLDRTEAANALQNTIWYIEDEITDVNQGLNTYEQSLAASFLLDTQSNAGSGIGDVKVLNVFTLSGGYAQDQLAMIPTPIPAPGAVFLGVVGLGFVGRIRRRQR